MNLCIKCKLYSDESNYRQLCMHCYFIEKEKIVV